MKEMTETKSLSDDEPQTRPSTPTRRRSSNGNVFSDNSFTTVAPDYVSTSPRRHGSSKREREAIAGGGSDEGQCEKEEELNSN